MKVIILNQQAELQLRQPEALEALIRAAATETDLIAAWPEDAALLVALVDEARMAALNEGFLGHAGSTDVLCFDYRDEGGEPPADPDADPEEATVAAEIFVCPAVACRRAGEFGHGPGRETLLYLVHGLLHLAGYDDHGQAQRQRMQQAENALVTLLAASEDPDHIFTPADATTTPPPDAATADHRSAPPGGSPSRNNG